MIKRLCNHQRLNKYQFDINEKKPFIHFQKNRPAYFYNNLTNYLTGVNFNFANGRTGVDRYVIQRYNWAEDIKTFPDYPFYTNEYPQLQIFIIPNKQNNRFRFNQCYDYNSKIKIDKATDNSESIVELEYHLNDIRSFEVLENDILLYILRYLCRLN
ncbi:MAG: hypothetical protein ACL7BU_12580 [Candidatus Phlomobacter fragariae]